MIFLSWQSLGFTSHMTFCSLLKHSVWIIRDIWNEVLKTKHQKPKFTCFFQLVRQQLKEIQSTIVSKKSFYFCSNGKWRRETPLSFLPSREQPRAGRPKNFAGKKFRPIRRRFRRRHRRRRRRRDVETWIGKNNLLTTFLWLRLSITVVTQERPESFNSGKGTR